MSNTNTKKGSFFILPISFLGDIFRTEYPFLLMLYYGIHDAGRRMNLNASFEHKCKALNYVWCRGQDVLTPMLARAMTDFEERGIVEKRFIWSTNIPEVPFLYDAISADTKLIEEVNNWYRTFKACESYNCTSLLLNVLERADTLSANHPVVGVPFFMVSSDLLFKERTLNNDLRRKLLYAVTFAICSIIGTRKRFAATTKDMILARTFGCTTPSELDNLLIRDKEIAYLYETISTRRHFEHLRADLLSSGMVKMFVGIGRKTYVSKNYCFDDLKEEIIHFRQKVKSTTQANGEIRRQLFEAPP